MPGGHQKRVCAEDAEKVLFSFQKENLVRRLDEEESFSINCRIEQNGARVAVRIHAVRLLNGSDIVVIGLSNIEHEAARERALKAVVKQSLTFSRIAQALADDYFSIYDVNVETGNFVEYSAHPQYRTLDIQQVGSDFFSTVQQNIDRVIYEKDREKMRRLFNKEVLLAALERDKTYTMTYRLVIGDEPVYVSMKASKLREDSKHIVIGVSNIDAQVRRERSFAQALDDATKLANRDALTGVKNKYAYSLAERNLNERILSDPTTDFAVVVCDINYLKDVNDHLGHRAGDDYIRSACALIQGIFRKSSIFRVGGDEFAVLLEGHDYENRNNLMEDFRKTVRQNQCDGGVVVAGGMATFLPDVDRTVADVFMRADAAMYEEKNDLKRDR